MDDADRMTVEEMEQERNDHVAAAGSLVERLTPMGGAFGVDETDATMARAQVAQVHVQLATLWQRRIELAALEDSFQEREVEMPVGVGPAIFSEPRD